MTFYTKEYLDLENSNLKEEDQINFYCTDGHHIVEIDQVLNERYQIHRKLGMGGSSTVWLCRDLWDERFVAVKVISNKLVYNKAAKEEIRLLKFVRDIKSDDPRGDKIVQLLDNFTIPCFDGAHICIVFELMGDSLHQFIEKSRVSGILLSTIKTIIKQVLDNLDYLHTKCRIIHTDIKPENILICMSEDEICKLEEEMGYKPKLINNHKQIDSKSKLSDISIKIGDLGNGCWVDDHSSYFISTRPYRAPEVIIGANYGPSADIWSVACMAFELATGSLLFNPSEVGSNTVEEIHLAYMMLMLGRIPNHVALSGKYSNFFFDENGDFRSVHVDQYGISRLLVEKFNFDTNIANRFVQFLLLMLKFDPAERVSARKCINHPWLCC